MKSTDRSRDVQGRYVPEDETLVVRSLRIRCSTLARLQAQADVAGVGITVHLRQILEAAAGQPCSRESL